MIPEQLDLNTLLDFALDAVWQAGRITLGYFQRPIEEERKADNTPVTAADREAEKRLRELIIKYWPNHGIIGEEYGQSPSDSPYTWIIDPIDGTKSFVAGVPLYSNLLALVDGERTLIGVANFPALGDTVYAVRDQGCYWNGRRARVSSVDELSRAVVLTSEFNYYGRRLPVWQEMVERSYIQRTWGDAYGYFLVATGRADVMLDPAMYVWDAAPFQVILEEAGGTFTDWQGEPTIHNHESLATNGALLDQVMEVVRGKK
jgi:histidinol phosphatase-like enzyme (inositol monophosphatase family)